MSKKFGAILLPMCPFGTVLSWIVNRAKLQLAVRNFFADQSVTAKIANKADFNAALDTRDPD